MRWRTTQDIFKDLTEHFDENWMNYDTIQTPPKPEWDYSRPLQIEDVDIWEVIYEQGGMAGVYAAWCPYAEFYMIRCGWYAESKGHGVETYYGPGAQEEVIKRCKELGFPVNINQIWVEDENMWLYNKPEPKTGTLILP
jgi:hypothetical protein